MSAQSRSPGNSVAGRGYPATLLPIRPSSVMARMNNRQQPHYVLATILPLFPDRPQTCSDTIRKRADNKLNSLFG